MYILSLELTKKCNLNCTYCYLGEKDNSIMSEDIAFRAIDIAIHEAKKQYDKTLHTYFIGGEPLIAIDLLRTCVKYIKLRGRQNELNLLFSTTTNGTLLNNDIIDYFILNNFEFKISIDGNKKVHDLNRRYYNNIGSYNDIIKLIPLLKKYENGTGKYVHAAHVLDSTNCSFFFESLVHLKKMGFTIVESGLNDYCDWTDEDIKILFDQLEQAVNYYIGIKKNKEIFVWVLFDAHLKHYFGSVCFYNCKAGLSSVFVSTSGNIYPCIEIDDNVCIGNVYNGLDVNRIREYAALKDSRNQECCSCDEYDHCEACGCIMSNYAINKDFYKPIKIRCLFTKEINSLIKNKFSEEQQIVLKNFFTDQKRKIIDVRTRYI